MMHVYLQVKNCKIFVQENNETLTYAVHYMEGFTSLPFGEKTTETTFI